MFRVRVRSDRVRGVFRVRVRINRVNRVRVSTRLMQFSEMPNIST